MSENNHTSMPDQIVQPSEGSGSAETTSKFKEFAIGDTVRLTCSSQPMTVSGFRKLDEEDREGQIDPPPHFVEVDWIAPTGSQRCSEYHPNALVAVEVALTS